MGIQVNNNFSSIEQATEQYFRNNSNKKNTVSDALTFQEVLQRKSEAGRTVELKFSKHAGARMSDRNINLSEEQMKRLEDGTRKANAKGIKESLMIMDDMAFIVNIKNNTVVTAMDSTINEENVFTNIDGAVIV